jgi:hypothetical protein
MCVYWCGCFWSDTYVGNVDIMRVLEGYQYDKNISYDAPYYVILTNILSFHIFGQIFFTSVYIQMPSICLLSIK